jgi:hypothetical protein
MSNYIQKEIQQQGIGHENKDAAREMNGSRSKRRGRTEMLSMSMSMSFIVGNNCDHNSAVMLGKDIS